MKLRFLEKCVDKNTGNEYNTNAEYVFDDERAREILATGLAEVVEDKQMPKTDENEQKKDLVPINVEERLNNGEVVNLYELSKAEVIEFAQNQNVSTKGTKEEIIERLLSSQE